jgi:hypothetical protein
MDIVTPTTNHHLIVPVAFVTLDHRRVTVFTVAASEDKVAVAALCHAASAVVREAVVTRHYRRVASRASPASEDEIAITALCHAASAVVREAVIARYRRVTLVTPRNSANITKSTTA